MPPAPDTDNAPLPPSSVACIPAADRSAEGIPPLLPTEDPRARAAWRTWLSALATDAEAAMAAALAYESLESESRDAWLDVLDQDAPGLSVPLVALYAPLLSVETDATRRTRMAKAMAPAALVSTSSDDVLALRGVAPDGSLVAIVVSPVYLHFVEVLSCKYRRDDGFLAVDHDPLRHIDEVSTEPGALAFGVPTEPTPLRVVVEELAHAILADRRAGRVLPKPLASFVHIFGPDFEASDGDLP